MGRLQPPAVFHQPVYGEEVDLLEGRVVNIVSAMGTEYSDIEETIRVRRFFFKIEC